MIRSSKSKFVAGVQCLKRLYLQVHSPELAGSSDGTNSIIDQGRKVGLSAQKAFPGGVMVEPNSENLELAIRHCLIHNTLLHAPRISFAMKSVALQSA
jgi:hypothetical protein